MDLGQDSPRCCVSQLIAKMHDLHQYADKNTQVDVARLNFSKAFDTVTHNKLLSKLSYVILANILLEAETRVSGR